VNHCDHKSSTKSSAEKSQGNVNHCKQKSSMKLRTEKGQNTESRRRQQKIVIHSSGRNFFMKKIKIRKREAEKTGVGRQAVNLEQAWSIYEVGWDTGWQKKSGAGEKSEKIALSRDFLMY
jgi:hypothetical protein